MVFSSLIFTFLFLPLTVCLYFIAKDKYRNYILLAASLIFYAYGEPKFVFVMILSIAVNYGFAFLIGRQRGQTGTEEMPRLGEAGRTDTRATIFLVLDVFINLALLFVYKYLNYTIVLINEGFGSDIEVPDIALPIGISFFTFQALSYCIDVYRGKVRVQKNPLYVALYISFFPQLIAGPIVRYSSIEEQITNRSTSEEDFAEGLKRFLIGFGKKVILANNLSLVADMAWGAKAANASAAVLWLGSICFSLQILYDFSGYSDMAIGLGRIFGFHFEENFDHPYTSVSVTEFWRRWHISLGRWFRDYVYIPLGGSRVSIPRNILNLLIVWLLTGIWHGANVTFLVWGLMYFVLLVIEKYLIRPDAGKSRLFSAFYRIVTLFFVNLGWVIFNSPNLKKGLNFIKGMFGLYGNSFVLTDGLRRSLREYGVFIVLGILFCTPVMKYPEEWLKKTEKRRLAGAVIIPAGCLFIFLWSVSFLILGSHNPFIYFNF